MAGAPADSLAIKVWDLPVRIVHWAMVVCLVTSIVTVKIGGNAMDWHVRSGIAMLVLVLFRVLWGFFGTRYSRFAGFVRGHGAVLEYARSMVRPRHATHVGHNPLGGWMVMLLLIALLIQAGTGLFSNDDIATDGPLVRYISKDLSDAIASFHRRHSWVVIGLAAVHIAAVLMYLAVWKENLIRPMLTGIKRLPQRFVSEAAGNTPLARAAFLFAVCALIVWLVTRRWPLT